MNRRQLIDVLWGLLRPQTYLLMVTYVVFGITYGVATQTENSAFLTSKNMIVIVLTLCALALWYIAGTAFNDYADYEIDKINLKGNKQRPLIMGLVDKKQLLSIAISASTASAILAALTGSMTMLALFVVMILLNMAYSLPPVQISHRGGLAPLLLPLGYIVLTVCSGLIIGGVTPGYGAGVIVVGTYLHFMSRIVLKDHRDVVGDKKMGKKTLVIKYGNKFVSMLALTLFVISTLMLVVSLWPIIKDGLLFICLLASAATMILYQLSNVSQWDYQKPLISMFGRLCSGVITICIFCFIAQGLDISTRGTSLTMIVIVTIFFWSLFDIKHLQTPAKKTKK